MMVTKGLYEHFKGKLYHVMAVAEHIETGERLVIYRQISKYNCQTSDQVWARPESIFEEILENGQPRFRRV